MAVRGGRARGVPGGGEGGSDGVGLASCTDTASHTAPVCLCLWPRVLLGPG